MSLTKRELRVIIVDAAIIIPSIVALVTYFLRSSFLELMVLLLLGYGMLAYIGVSIIQERKMELRLKDSAKY